MFLIPLLQWPREGKFKQAHFLSLGPLIEPYPTFEVKLLTLVKNKNKQTKKITKNKQKENKHRKKTKTPKANTRAKYSLTLGEFNQNLAPVAEKNKIKIFSLLKTNSK